MEFFESTDQTMGFNGLEQRGILLAPWKFSRVNIIFTFCLRTNTKCNVSDFSQSLFIEKMLLASQSCLVIHSVSRRYLLNQSTEVTATGAKDVKDPVPVWQEEQPQQGSNERAHSSQSPGNIQYLHDWVKSPLQIHHNKTLTVVCWILVDILTAVY